ncbi:MAG: hypothetical protein R3C15_21805 [Thermoleophilia bacterium]
MSVTPIGYEFWRDRKSGEVWAIELEDGRVRGVAGPIDPKLASYATLGAADYRPDEAQRIDHARESFALHPIVTGPDS